MSRLIWSLMWSPLAANLVLAMTGPRLARALPPRVGVRLLPAAMVVVATGTGAVLASLGFLALAQVPAVAALGDWSPIALRATQPGPVPVEVAAGLAMLLLLGSAVRHTLRAGHHLVRADAACRRIGAHTHGLIVVDDDVPDAYALPTLPGHLPGHPQAGINGRIVVSTAMLRALSSEERRVLLAHEAAHLAGHHHLYVQLAELAGAANPLLRPTARGVRLAVERDADEAAAIEAGDSASPRALSPGRRWPKPNWRRRRRRSGLAGRRRPGCRGRIRRRPGQGSAVTRTASPADARNRTGAPRGRDPDGHRRRGEPDRRQPRRRRAAARRDRRHLTAPTPGRSQLRYRPPGSRLPT